MQMYTIYLRSRTALATMASKSPRWKQRWITRPTKGMDGTGHPLPRVSVQRIVGGDRLRYPPRAFPLMMTQSGEIQNLIQIRKLVVLARTLNSVKIPPPPCLAAHRWECQEWGPTSDEEGLRLDQPQGTIGRRLGGASCRCRLRGLRLRLHRCRGCGGWGKMTFGALLGQIQIQSDENVPASHWPPVY